MISFLEHEPQIQKNDISKSWLPSLSMSLKFSSEWSLNFSADDMISIPQKRCETDCEASKFQILIQSCCLGTTSL